MFTFTSIMVKIDTDTWQHTFLIVTLVSVVFINTNAAIFQGGILGVAGKFPPAYMGAVFAGQAVGGIFASGTNVVVLAMGASATDAAFFCFVIRTEFYQHYLGEKTQDFETKEVEDSKLLKKDEKDGAP